MRGRPLMQIAIIGAGGFAHELAWHIENSQVISFENSTVNEPDFVFISKDDALKKSIGSFKVKPEYEFLNSAESKKSFFSVAIGDTNTRISITNNYIGRGLYSASIISNFARIGFETSLGKGSIICPNVTIMPGVQIGNFFQAHLNSYVAHNCIIGDFVTLLPGSMVSGYVTVEDHALIGAGAIIRNGTASKRIRIGKSAIVGMGSVVTNDVPDGHVVVGNPAKTLYKL